MTFGPQPDTGFLLRRLFQGSGTAFAIYVVGAGVAYFAQLSVARFVGAASYGIYAYVLAWMTILAYCASLGFHVSLLRFVPVYRVQQAWHLLRGATQYAERTSGVLGISMALLGLSIVTIWGKQLSPELSSTFSVGFFMIPILAFLWIRSAIVRSFGGVVSAMAPDRIVRDSTLLLLIGAMALGGWHDVHAPLIMAATLVSSTVGLALVSLAVHRSRPPSTIGIEPAYAAALWLRTGLPLVIMIVAQLIMNRTGVVLLGWLGRTTDAGIFALAYNVTFVVALPQTAVNVLFAPMVADLFERNDRDALQSIFTKATAAIFLAGVCIAIPLAFLAQPVLAWFGRDFSDGLSAVHVLLIGQVIASGSVTRASLMAMTGHERGAAVLLVLCGIGNALLGAILIRTFGTLGAAVAFTISLIVCNVAMSMFIWRTLSLAPGVLMGIRRLHPILIRRNWEFTAGRR